MDHRAGVSITGKPIKKVARSKIKLCLKIFVSIIALAIILHFVPIKDSIAILLSANIGIVILSILFLTGRNIFAALRWRLLLLAKGHSISLFYLTGVYLTSSFVAMALPSGLGSEIARGTCLVSRVPLSTITGSILVERLMSYVALMLIWFGAALWMDTSNVDAMWPKIWLPVGLLAVLGLLIIFSGPFLRILNRIVVLNRVTGILITLRTELTSYNNLQVLLIALLCSVCFQVTGVVAVYLSGLAIGNALPFSVYALSLPLVWLVSIVPVSIGGLGVQEGAFIVLLSSFGATTSEATGISILWLVVRTFSNLLGAVTFMIPGSRVEIANGLHGNKIAG